MSYFKIVVKVYNVALLNFCEENSEMNFLRNERELQTHNISDLRDHKNVTSPFSQVEIEAN